MNLKPILLLAAALLTGACSAPKQAVTDTKNHPGYFGPSTTNKVTVSPPANVVYPGETVKKAIPVTQPISATRAGNGGNAVSVGTKPTPKYYPWGTINPQIWHVHMNDQGDFTSDPIEHKGKLYRCQVGQYGAVSWHSRGMFGIYSHIGEHNYAGLDQAVIDNANRQIATANAKRPFVPAGPLPDSEKVGFVTVNWGSLKTVHAQQTTLLQKSAMTTDFKAPGKRAAANGG